MRSKSKTLHKISKCGCWKKEYVVPGGDVDYVEDIRVCEYHKKLSTVPDHDGPNCSCDCGCPWGEITERDAELCYCITAECACINS
jgi:hypothetical protein